ncbi:MAG: hypothetical protein DRR19_24670 [Candidatus Parabeggiatoa sp. nov. 1]|nr:MAG: hypothetical protein DRR19_24670 [Gammaproteobacteria bacterium]
MDTVICVIRTPTGLKAKVSRYQSKFSPPDSDAPAWQNLYATVLVPLAEVKSSPEIQHLSAAWQRLASVTKWDAATLTDVLVVLTESVANYDTASLSIPSLRIPTAPEPPKPTAAHPRAFRGTKYKPPKPKRPTPVNLQIELCNFKNQVLVLQTLWQHRHNAVKLLCALGYAPAWVETLMALATPPAEPGLFLRYPDVPRHAKAQLLPGPFREEILPLLRGIAWYRVEAMLELYWHLNWHELLELRTTLSRFFAQFPTQLALDWLQPIAHQPCESQFMLLIFVIELKVAHSPCQAGVAEVLTALQEYAPPERYPRWTYLMLAALREGISARYLREGIQLAGEFEPHYRFAFPQPCQDFSRQVLDEVLYRLPDDELSDKAMRLWRATAQLPGLCEVLATVVWANLTPQQVNEYLQLLLSFAHYYVDTKKEADSWQTKWRLFKQHCNFIEKHLFSLADIKKMPQWTKDFNCFISQEIEEDIFEAVLKEAAILATRLAQASCQSDSDRGLAYAPFFRIRDAQLRQRVLETPTNSLKRLNNACRRENEAQLIAWGIESMVKKQPQLTVDSLWFAPNKLAKTAKLLGPMSWELCHNIMQAFAQHPIVTTYFESLSLPQIYQCVQSLEATHRYNPIPRALRNHFEGQLRLRQTQLERHRQIILARLLQMQLQVLAEIAEQTLWQGFEMAAKTPNMKSALQFLRDLCSRQFANKRAFRHFIKEYVAGNVNYLQHHPLTLRWAKAHPNISLERWTYGIQLESYEEKQYVTINLEQHPLEVLKLGTYVGSCLGVGGLCTDSAAAVVLDINKQVLYARDVNGVVLARQLVAISKDEQLVAFEVYPAYVSSQLKTLFYEYNQHFANLLGIELFKQKSEDDNYQIESILAENWWDDGAWNFGND